MIFISGAMYSLMAMITALLSTTYSYPFEYEPLVRLSSSCIGPPELEFVTQRKVKTDDALKKWLSHVAPEFNSSMPLPRVSLTSSGGAYIGFLLGVGVVRELDGRENTKSLLSGLYQGLTYHSGVSAGALIVGSLAGNGYPTVSHLADRLWLDRIEKGITWYPPPPGFQNEQALADQATDIAIQDLPFHTEVWKRGLMSNDVLRQANIQSKQHANFTPTIIDVYARIFAYHFLEEESDRSNNTLSNLVNLPEFQSYSVPYPIITAQYVAQDQCLPSKSYPSFEFHPFEYGSWDRSVAAFAQTKQMRTKPLDNPANGRGYQMYDHISQVMATSANVLFPMCEYGPEFADMLVGDSWVISKYLNEVASGDEKRDFFAVFPNPFFGQKDVSKSVSSSKELKFVDGGSVKNLNPVWPLIQDARAEYNDVIIVVDVSGFWGGYKSGLDLHHTWKNAQRAELKHMPKIPTPATFVELGLDQQATFFGCESRNSTAVVVYIPHVMYPNAPISSDQSFLKTSYTKDESMKMMEVGRLLVTQNGDPGWPYCLACAILLKTSVDLPECRECFQKHCWNGTVIEAEEDETVLPWETNFDVL